MTPSTNNGLLNVYNVALSQNKASFITSGGQMTVYKHEGNGWTILVFSKTVSGLILDGTSKQYSIAISCICKEIKRLQCFSQTLKCVILNRAEKDCIEDGDTYTTWPSSPV